MWFLSFPLCPGMNIPLLVSVVRMCMRHNELWSNNTSENQLAYAGCRATKHCVISLLYTIIHDCVLPNICNMLGCLTICIYKHNRLRKYCIKGIFRDPLIWSTLFFTHTDFIVF